VAKRLQARPATKSASTPSHHDLGDDFLQQTDTDSLADFFKEIAGLPIDVFTTPIIRGIDFFVFD
jgi:hypothetical protein